ncbi:hypothetical protein NQ318_016353, partial [Aromia moschata]
ANGKNYGPKGAKKVGAAISGERGRTITGVFCVSASGNYVPHMLIYPRKRMAATLQKNGPIGTSFRCLKNGWINSELFVEWLKHFEQHVKPTDINPILLVLDNHASHISIRAYNFCKEKHIHMVSLPPHTSDNLQPLDLTVDLRFEICCICGELGQDRELWYRCVLCSSWNHALCTGVDTPDNYKYK